MPSGSENLKGIIESKDEYAYGFRDPEKPVFKTRKGLDHEIINQICDLKNEPDWMREFRHKSLDIFWSKPMPNWGSELLQTVDLDDIYYYLKPVEEQGRTWDDVPEDIKKTFDRLGIPEAERTVLAGVGAQYESESVYHSLKKEWEDKGVIFLDTDQALRELPDIFRKYWATVVPPNDNKFAALNSAVWSGGSFVYVPKGVKVDVPMQAYFRINAERMGQFERTLIIIEDDAYAHYIEGCTAPTYSSDSLHAAVVEVIVKKGARFRYSTIQNWSSNVFNLVTKRAVAYEDAVMEWVDGNIGSKLTMKYPAIYLMGERAHGEVLSVAFAKDGMHQDAGAKVIHVAPNTTSKILSKSISKGTGRSSYRGLCKIYPGAVHARSDVECDALLLDENSQTDTYPTIEVEEQEATVGHEASVSKISDEQIFYIGSRGISEDEARTMIVRGFMEPVVKVLPLEYAVEWNRLVELEMEGSVG
ncbi:MAG: Fe-S cluster assembly protein SufB [SAR324 cluster bacterium]|uniref:Fe-S cluster assembly protein SufB n=1 Tax=SAR324 cluster bacterium TaxID=2024889 RepID=A0A7X9FSG5_9DELT|nr:Fe-S cluster assembly protein SufB [SAR324 cluster bacterium]